MNYELLKAQQNDLLEKIYSPYKKDTLSNSEGVLKDIESLSLDDCIFAFGEFGQRLKLFCDEIDISHPDLSSVYNGHLVGYKENTFSQECVDFLKLIYFVKQNKLSLNILKNLRDSIFLNQYFSKIDKCIDSPLKNQLHIRFLKDKKLREKTRLTKKTQHVFLSDSLLRIKTYWEDCPEDLNQYIRISSDINKSDQVKKASNRFKNLLDHGLTNMADEVDRQIKQIKEDIYFGFNKVTLPFVSTVLAKICGFNRNVNSHKASLVLSKEDLGTGNIESYFPFIHDFQLYSKAYNYYEIIDMVPSYLNELISYLECFPELGNRPLFDHYRIIFPSLNVKNKNFPVVLKNKDGSTICCESLEDLQKNIDCVLFKENNFIGALLGERDGVHFFISYFMEL
jgi:hypothetical protein